MNAAARLALFAAALSGVFGAAVLVGGAAGPAGGVAPAGAAGARAGHQTAEHGAAGHTAAAPAGPLPGLQIAQDGYRLVMDRTRYPQGVQTLTFRITGPSGAVVREFAETHTKRLHLIVARRDLATFEHLHPGLAQDGTWTGRADLRRAGAYRVFADFSTGGRALTLGADLDVAGAYDPVDLPAPAATARTRDGLEVTLRDGGTPLAGREQRPVFEVRAQGRPVDSELDPYLGARGHLVALRAGDLAYLHTHPGDGDRLTFMTDYPSPGSYRLWVQFSYRGRVQTAAFTQEVTR
ncbi:hypothetical protein ACRYCC_29830 [Actinomadura scrupuli]|uniref:hypothetical protein n=1 Tax=Actinomadura scrupuli TaxID=559629 RepID=UPI003D97E7E9